MHGSKRGLLGVRQTCVAIILVALWLPVASPSGADASLLVRSLATVPGQADPAPAPKGPPAPDPASVREQYYAALNRGDVAGVMALYADDAVYSGVGTCRLTLCVGRERIQQEIQRQVADQAQITLLSANVSGNTVSGTWSADATRIRLAGVERIVGTDTVELRAGRIVANRVAYDASDPQTAILIEWLQEQQSR